MTPEYAVYLNGNYFDSLADSDAFGDRPEPYRHHERSLWTIYQLARLGEHEVVITDKLKTVVFSTRKAAELKAWIEKTYPDCVARLDHPIYTRFAHPADTL